MVGPQKETSSMPQPDRIAQYSGDGTKIHEVAKWPMTVLRWIHKELSFGEV
jgi:hypothetical protein